MKLKPYLFPIATGLLIGTSYIPFPPWAIFFGLVPLFLFWSETASVRKAALGGWISQFILSLIGFPWIAYTATEFGHFPWWGGALSLIGFAAIAHLHYAIAGALAVYARKTIPMNSLRFFTLTAVLFALSESVYPMIFPWHLGYPWLWAGFPGAQFADVIGFEGLNVVTIAANAMIACAVSFGLFHPLAFHAKKRALSLIAGAVALVVVVNLLGLGRADRWKHPDASLKILTVQGNIGNFDKMMVDLGPRNFRAPIIKKFLDLTAEGLAQHPDAQMVMWPETAFPDALDIPYQNEASAAPVRRFIIDHHVPLLTGSYSYERTTKATYNGLFFFDALGVTPEPPYRKSILLIFGETFPLSDTIPYMDKLFPDLGSFGRGDGPRVMNASLPGLPTVRIGPQICYEGLYPWFTVGLAKKGAQILANVTNDSWFGIKFEPFQHLYMTLARAIEVRRPLIRSTNTGITTAITAAGEILQKSPQAQEWTGLYEVPYLINPPHTTFEILEGFWIWILIAALALILGEAKLRMNTKAE